MLPKLVRRVLNKFDERDEQSPRMRSIYDQSFQQNSRDLLLDHFGVGLGEQVQERARKVVGVTVGVA